MKKIKMEDSLSFFVLAILILVFGILTRGGVFSTNNILSLVNQSVNTIIAGLGMIFVVAMGATDITQGSLVAVAAAAGGIAAMEISPFLAFPVAIVIGIVSGSIMGIINAKFKVPSFMVSLSLLIALRALVSLILNSRAIILPAELAVIDKVPIKLTVIVILTAVITFILERTPFGSHCKAIGENENAVRFTGANVSKIKITAFIMSGLMTGIASIFVMARLGGANNTMGSGFEMRIMMAMFIGGIPVSGGMKTKIHKLLLGAPMIVLLENGLVLCGASGAITQLARGIVLLGVVYATGLVKRKTLALEQG